MPTTKITESKHPEYTLMSDLWRKYRFAYLGGKAFLEAYLTRYSKRELKTDFRERKDISYVPAYAKRTINTIRNALALKLPDVSRTGDPRYVDAMNTDVDNSKSSMNGFLALNVIPLMLAQGKRYVFLDSNKAAPGTTLAQDQVKPFCYAVNAEDVLSWGYSADGRLIAVLMQAWVEVVDPVSLLVTGTEQRYRHYLLGTDVATNKSGVQITEYAADGTQKGQVTLVGLTRMPVVELKLVEALLTDIADMQIALLNLSSSDMSFLYRANFPIYTEQYDPTRGFIKPVASKKATDNPSRNVQDRDSEEEIFGTSPAAPNEMRAGTMRGRGYEKGMERPAFIAPPTQSIELSMRKQDEIKQDITVMADLALTSLSVKALEQSGKSKEADRIGEEAGLAYIASVLETAEREIAAIWHELLGSTTPYEVKYPQGFTVRTSEDRLAAVTQLRSVRGALRSEAYTKAIDRRIAELVLKNVGTQADLAESLKEIEEMDYYDEDQGRATIVQKDVQAGVLSKETAAKIRGFPEGESEKVVAEQEAQAQGETAFGSPSFRNRMDDSSGIKVQ